MLKMLFINHYCLQLGDAKKAASCAYTFLEYNPDHVLMTSYLERYVATPGNDPKDIVSLDQKKYQELYIRAIGLHQRSEYAEECRVVEEVIEGYLEAEEDCKILCEDFSPQRIWTRDFPAVATAQNLPRACEANQSFLLLVPDDADMWHNQAFYAQLPNVEEAWFKAREARVSPKCGRMVAFSAGPENLHGVLPVERGRRCALALWFTLDPKYRERDMEFASHVLRRAAPQRRRSTSPPGGTRGDAGTSHESALKHGARARLSDEL
ncbi:leprecan, putative [Ixodes scapularis]|uniref:Leprecan, putative n=1 Tax=Ixodes scapularis TaxID=6945 RepID=B7Q0T2_IXOSC|nr:leprecan, putative [Ixodes scapularis]|eukprot:XP_002408293.1 leprecan, putative [Ixodes scapularis]